MSADSFFGICDNAGDSLHVIKVPRNHVNTPPKIAKHRALQHHVRLLPAMSSPPPSPLYAVQSSLLSLLTQCRESLNTPTTPQFTPIPNALPLLHSAATLAKAHTTRLAIALRPPVSPDIATQFLSELRDTVIPSFTAAAASLRADRDQVGHVLAKAATQKAEAVLKALEEFVGDIEGGEGRLVNTGIVWATIEALLKVKDCAGVVEGILDGAGELIADAGEELKEWIEEEGEDEKDDGEEEDDEAQWSDDGEEDDKFFGSKSTTPKDQAMVELAKTAQKRIRLTGILLAAAKKRRLAVGAEGRVDHVARLDKIAVIAKELEVLVDDLGSAIYEEEKEEAVCVLSQAVDITSNLSQIQARKQYEAKVVELAEALAMGKDGKEDKFTVWFSNCKSAMVETA